MSIIIGIDPGIDRVGFALIKVESTHKTILDCGIISTAKTLSVAKRLAHLRTDLITLLKELTTQYTIDLLAIELLYFSTNIKTAIQVAQARGIILEAISHYYEKEILEITPTKMKNIIAGHGKADKKAIQESIKREFNLNQIIKPDDANDAIAIALAGYYINRIN